MSAVNKIPATRDLVDIAVALERRRQLQKFGDQRHPDGTGNPMFEFFAEATKARCARLAEAGRLDWKHILEEEFWEAVAETDPKKIRVELIQVMAVCKAWIQDIDSRPDPGDGKFCQAV